MMGRIFSKLFLFSVFSSLVLVSCKKNQADTGPYELRYGSNVLYMKNQQTDYIVYPDQSRAGTYTGFPDGIELDERTGAINVTDSETGLRYRITHTAPNGDTTSVIVTLSGITFTDKFYHLSQNDSIAFPVYNANPALPVPVSGSSFDEGNLANAGGCSVRTNNGQINLAETIRNGVFGNTPQNDVRRDFDIDYRLNDASGKALNKLRVRLYYYDSMNDVPPDLWETLNDRQNQGVFLQANNSIVNTGTARSTGTNALAKPRPPCVIIIGQ